MKVNSELILSFLTIVFRIQWIRELFDTFFFALTDVQLLRNFEFSFPYKFHHQIDLFRERWLRVCVCTSPSLPGLRRIIGVVQNRLECIINTNFGQESVKFAISHDRFLRCATVHKFTSAMQYIHDGNFVFLLAGCRFWSIYCSVCVRAVHWFCIDAPAHKYYQWSRLEMGRSTRYLGEPL